MPISTLILFAIGRAQPNIFRAWRPSGDPTIDSNYRYLLDIREYCIHNCLMQLNWTCIAQPFPSSGVLLRIHLQSIAIVYWIKEYCRYCQHPHSTDVYVHVHVYMYIKKKLFPEISVLGRYFCRGLILAFCGLRYIMIHFFDRRPMNHNRVCKDMGCVCVWEMLATDLWIRFCVFIFLRCLTQLFARRFLPRQR